MGKNVTVGTVSLAGAAVSVQLVDIPTLLLLGIAFIALHAVRLIVWPAATAFGEALQRAISRLWQL